MRGFAAVRVSSRMVYTDDSRPEMVEAFVRKIIIPMVEGVERQALESGQMDKVAWDRGILGLHETASPAGDILLHVLQGDRA